MEAPAWFHTNHAGSGLMRVAYFSMEFMLVLGIGGWRLLAALGIQPEVCHLNEGIWRSAGAEPSTVSVACTGR